LDGEDRGFSMGVTFESKPGTLILLAVSSTSGSYELLGPIK